MYNGVDPSLFSIMTQTIGIVCQLIGIYQMNKQTICGRGKSRHTFQENSRQLRDWAKVPQLQREHIVQLDIDKNILCIV